MPDQKRTAVLDWEDVRYFTALARHGSLSATARTLRVNHATVARRIAALEAMLGQTLFDRRRDGYALTREGAAVLGAASAMDEAALTILQRRAAGAALTGRVRLTTLRGFADGFLVDRLGALHRRHPGLEIELIAESRTMSLSRREADIALRFGRPKGGELVARRAAKIAFGIYAAPVYRDRIEDGAEPRYIGFDAESDDVVPEAAWLTRHVAAAQVSFRSNSQLAQAAAARAGIGLALLPHYLGAGDPQLAPMSAPAPLPERELWLVMRPDLARVPRIRTVADALIELCRRERALLAGD